MRFESNSQYFEKNLFNEDDINIFFGSYEVNLSNKIAHSPYTTDYYTINICTKGSYNIYTNDRKFTIKENTLYIELPYTQVKKEFLSDSSDAMYIIIKGAALRQYFQALGISEENILFPYPVNEKHTKLLDEIIKLLSTYTEVTFDSDINPKVTHFRNSQDATARRMHRRGLFYVFLSELFELYEEHRKKDTLTSNSKLYVKKATEYIEENYNSDINVDKVANYLGFNRSYLYKIFRKELGCSVQDFIIQTKLRVACSLLKHTDLSIKSVAISVNYDSIIFSRVFKKNIGMTPMQYRKQNTKQ